jgi:uncharacterized protein
MLTKFARSLCRNFSSLKTEGHAKWQEVAMALPALGKGWSYYGPSEKELLNCDPSKIEPTSQTPPPGKRVKTEPATQCTQANKMLGICR